MGGISNGGNYMAIFLHSLSSPYYNKRNLKLRHRIECSNILTQFTRTQKRINSCIHGGSGNDRLAQGPKT